MGTRGCAGNFYGCDYGGNVFGSIQCNSDCGDGSFIVYLEDFSIS